MSRTLVLLLCLAGCSNQLHEACRELCAKDVECSGGNKKTCVEDCKIDGRDFGEKCLDLFEESAACYAEASCNERVETCGDVLGRFYARCDRFLELGSPADESAFACTDGTSVPWQDVCDGISACDGSDEAGCTAPCDPQLFACADLSCIPRPWVCDNFEDCPDASDESACE